MPPADLMPGGLTHKSGRAIPIHIIAAPRYAAWLKKQRAPLRRWLAAQDFTPKPGAHILLPDVRTGALAGVLAVVSEPVSVWDIASLPQQLPAKTYALQAGDDAAQEKLALGWALGAYRFRRYYKSETDKARALLQRPPQPVVPMARALNRARDLINTPANDLGPDELAAAIAEVGKAHKAQVRVVRGDALLKENYPLIHTVGCGSARPPCLVDLRWGNPQHSKVTLVGKGVCFDSGGYDIKPSDAMRLMKKDMGGAAVALAVAEQVMAEHLPVRLRLLVPAVENMISGAAFRPLDVMTSRKGLTIENGNTDAEGRLVLADALTEADSENPDLLLDFATLTGAARVALGVELPALFSNSDVLAEDLLQAARDTEDPLWRLPLWAEHKEKLQSRIADLNSCPGGGYAGAILAALFLEHFVSPKTPWAHIDMMAWNLTARPGRPAGGEAMAARAILHYLRGRFAGSPSRPRKTPK